MKFLILSGCTLVAALMSGAAALAQTAPTADPSVVEAQPLQSLDLFSAAGRATGLRPDLWRGASADLARAAFQGLGARPLEPGISQLARDVLATGATAPDSAGGDNDLAADRVMALVRLGDIEAARAILARTPGLPSRVRLSQAAAEAALWTGDPKHACAIGDSLAEGRDGVFWLRLRAFCLAQAGKGEEAQLALDLAPPTAVHDPALSRLLAARVSGTINPGAATADTALGYALSRSLKLDGASAVSSAGVPGLISMASDETATPELRRLAAWRLISTGIDAPEAIRAALLLPTPAVDPAGPGKSSRRKGVSRVSHPVAGPQEQAVALARLYVAARSAADPLERARALASLLRSDSAAGFRTLSVVTAPELALVEPQGLSPGDRLVLAVAASTVDAPSAQGLRDSLKVDEPGAVSPADMAILDAIHAAGSPEHAVGEVLDRLIDQGDRFAVADRSRAQAAAAILFGIINPKPTPLSSMARARLAAFQPGPAQHVAGALLAETAVERQAAGEVALLTLIASSADNLGAADRALLLRALSRVGLGRQARSIAMDGLIPLIRR